MNETTLLYRVCIMPLAVFVLWSCDDTADEEPLFEAPPVYEATYSRTDPAPDHTFMHYAEPTINAPLHEISGLATGRKNPQAVYAVEDSGNRNVIFVKDSTGVLLGELVLFGAINRDWEDLAIGPGPEPGETYLYVADFGDNRSTREWVRIYRVAEPLLQLDTVTTPFKLIVTEFDLIKYKYPDGPRDAETLMIHPHTRNLTIITKREPRVRVYELPYPQSTTEYATCHFRGDLPFRTIVGGDISPDGNEILIKDYGAIYYWNRLENQDPIYTMFHNIPGTVAYIPEVQGESIAWTKDGNGYFTITETETIAADPILHLYKRQ